MSRQKILIQLDPDDHASSFDAVVAVDAGVDRLLQYARVRPDQVRDLVHGAIFTRGAKDLHQTAIFIGGSRVADGEQLLRKATEAFFGPLRVSVMLDANGANTTAAAAVLAAGDHQALSGTTAVVLGGTGPVGQRVALLLAREGADVRLASRSRARAAAACGQIADRVPGARLEPCEIDRPEAAEAALRGAAVVIAAGALGVELLPAEILENAGQIKVAVDLNAVPPLGIGGIEVTDRAITRKGVVCYGAIGVGAAKMQIHKAAIERLFRANDQVLDAEEIYQIGRNLLG